MLHHDFAVKAAVQSVRMDEAPLRSLLEALAATPPGACWRQLGTVRLDPDF